MKVSNYNLLEFDYFYLNNLVVKIDFLLKLP
jgi:hypothetical protein